MSSHSHGSMKCKDETVSTLVRMCNYISLHVYKTPQNTKEGLHGKMHGTPTSNINLFRLSCSFSETHTEFGSTPLHNRIPIRDPDVYHVSLTIANSYWGIDSHASRPLPSTLAPLRLLAVHLPAFAPAAYSVHRCHGMGEFGFCLDQVCGVEHATSLSCPNLLQSPLSRLFLVCSVLMRSASMVSVALYRLSIRLHSAEGPFCFGCEKRQ